MGSCRNCISARERPDVRHRHTAKIPGSTVLLKGAAKVTKLYEAIEECLLALLTAVDERPIGYARAR